ncbi:putative insulysin [Rosa chinensis]|uniref:Putative insulysin n=1 Tax=Rosa chinensis TaxID=74649 RepID=A0A2P6S962_ROSCH|nr:putative insulysin [Rosa chinensis]
MRIDAVSKPSFMSEDFQCEPWFGSHYTEEYISPSLIDLWKDLPEIDVSLHLPEKMSSFLLIFPFVLMVLILQIQLLRDANLIVSLLKDELSEIVYQASVAKLETSVSVLSTDKLELKVYIFNDKLPALLSKILKTTKSVMPISDHFMRKLKNTNMKPLSHSTCLRVHVLFQRFYDVDEKLHVLSGLSISDVKLFISQLWSKVYIEGLCHGNLSEKEAISRSDIFKTNFGVQPLPVELMRSEQCICLPPSANLIRDISVKNKSETNLMIELYFQIERELRIESPRLRALIDLFNDIVEEPLFNQLSKDWTMTLWRITELG